MFTEKTELFPEENLEESCTKKVKKEKKTTNTHMLRLSLQRQQSACGRLTQWESQQVASKAVSFHTLTRLPLPR